MTLHHTVRELATEWFAIAAQWFATAARWLYHYGLLVPLVQLLLATVFAFIFAERWQRWRQRREFQYRTMSKLSETSTELFVLLADMLTARATGRPVDAGLLEKQRLYIVKRTAFHALEADIMASFTRSVTMEGYYALNGKANELFKLVQSAAAPAPSQYEPVQSEFQKLQKVLFGQMASEMKLLTWRERRRLRKDPTWGIE